MADRRPPSFHFGGPLGLAGMTMLVGSMGLLSVGGGLVDTPQTTGTDPVSPAGVTTAAVDRPKPQPKPTTPDTPPASAETARTDLGDETPTDRPDTPANTAKPEGLPPKPPKPAPPVIKPATDTRAAVTFIVRIKGSGDVDDAARLYRKDRAAAEAAFARYQATQPELKDFRLIGSSYSGEVKLAYDMPRGQAPSRKAINALKDQILSVDGVSYADPDFIAHPGQKDD